MPVSLQVHVRSVTIGRNRVLSLAQSVLSLVGERSADMSILLVGDRRMRSINRRFRHKDRSTDVLAFAFREAGGPHDFDRDAAHLGDVVISVPTAQRQAKAARRPLEEELVALLIHGVLHLCGYDHERSKAEALRMARKERQIQRSLGTTSRFLRVNHTLSVRSRKEV
ncbi:MAG TPA: rRNA maturation RNase YbeY [Nitrospira sp.]|nr:rRNA maturation RNase YbeY [Nitrospira sp.]